MPSRKHRMHSAALTEALAAMRKLLRSMKGEEWSASSDGLCTEETVFGQFSLILFLFL